MKKLLFFILTLLIAKNFGAVPQNNQIDTSRVPTFYMRVVDAFSSDYSLVDILEELPFINSYIGGPASIITSQSYATLRELNDGQMARENALLRISLDMHILLNEVSDLERRALSNQIGRLNHLINSQGEL